MGLAELVDRIERDGAARVAAIRAETQRELDAIGEEARRARSIAREAKLAALRSERRARLDRAREAARREATALRLDAEHAFVARVLARAAERWTALEDDPRWIAALPAQIEAALGFTGGRAVIVRCRPAIAPAVRAAIAGRADIAIDERADAPVGLVIAAQDGSMQVDDSLDARLARARGALAIALLDEVGR